VLARLGSLPVVTDDNMATEWGRIFTDPPGPWVPEVRLLDSPPFELVEDGGASVLVSSAGDSIHVEPGRLQGSLDDADIRDGTVLLSGWAADVHRAAPVESVAIFVSGTFLALGTTGTPRPDLTQGFGLERLRRAGFTYALPLRSFKPGPQPRLRAFALGGGAASELPYGDAFPWATPSVLPSHPYVLTAVDGTEILLSPTGDSIPIGPNEVRGFLDGARFEDGRVALFGWAANVAEGRPADSLLVFLDGQFLALGTTGAERPDLVSGFGNPALQRAGFRLAVAAHPTTSSPPPPLRVFALAPDGTASELAHGGGLAAPVRREPVEEEP
jgi:hypothetical protein